MTRGKINEEFLAALNSSEDVFSEISFEKDRYIEKGYAQYVYYKNKNVKAEFLFGPPDWHIDMIIYVSNKKYSFADLLKIPVILDWVNNNRYKQENSRNIQNELLWFIDLLRVSLPILSS
jgi:hypothetical protein